MFCHSVVNVLEALFAFLSFDTATIWACENREKPLSAIWVGNPDLFRTIGEKKLFVAQKCAVSSYTTNTTRYKLYAVGFFSTSTNFSSKNGENHFYAQNKGWSAENWKSTISQQLGEHMNRCFQAV